MNVNAIEKLLDYVASGIGAVAAPMLAPWKASREGKAKLISARKNAEARIIQAESEGEALKIIAKAQSEAKEQYLVTQNEETHGTVEINHHDITQRIEFQERKRMANIKSVIGKAANMLTDKKVTDYEPDPDWTARFFDCIQDISSEDMQKIWAKILAGEVERPGKTSLRTMDILRNMTKKDAEMFEKITGFVIGNDFIFYEYSFLKPSPSSPISFDSISNLQDCGLIRSSISQKEIGCKDGAKIFLKYHGNGLEISKCPNAKEMIDIHVFVLTAAGKELLQVVQSATQMEYLQIFSRFLELKNYELFHLEDVTNLSNGRFTCHKRTKIQPKSEQSRDSTT